MTCGDEHSTINNAMKVSLQGAKVDANNPHDLCFELGTGRSTLSMENSGVGIPRNSIQPLDHADNYLLGLSQARGTIQLLDRLWLRTNYLMHTH